MNETSFKRITFFEQLHEFFLMKKGYGAFAYISVNDANSLFDKYMESSESAELFIKQNVRSI